jgi:hypothetical protein
MENTYLGTNSKLRCYAHSHNQIKVKEKIIKIILIDVTILFML